MAGLRVYQAQEHF